MKEQHNLWVNVLFLPKTAWLIGYFFFPFLFNWNHLVPFWWLSFLILSWSRKWNGNLIILFPCSILQLLFHLTDVNFGSSVGYAVVGHTSAVSDFSSWHGPPVCYLARFGPVPMCVFGFLLRGGLYVAFFDADASVLRTFSSPGYDIIWNGWTP